MLLTLIGMSSVGKTHWARLLEVDGFERFSIDDCIERRLKKHLSKNKNGTEAMADWLGFPYDERYEKRAELYLTYEQEETEKALEEALSLPQSTDVVIDTTGSVISLSEKILQRLYEESVIAFLHSPNYTLKKMYASFLKNPKPIIWGDQFYQKKEESPHEALARCYPALLNHRLAQYKKWAHITLAYNELRTEKFDAKQFVNSIQHKIK